MIANPLCQEHYFSSILPSPDHFLSIFCLIVLSRCICLFVSAFLGQITIYTTLSSRSLGLTVMLLFEFEVELEFELEELLEVKACR